MKNALLNKKTGFILLALIMSTGLFAQQQTLFQQDGITHGGFGGPVIKLTKINDDYAMLLGGRGGWIINKTLTIGGGGYGLVNNITLTDNEEKVLEMGYGGFELGLIMASDKIIHFSANALVGAGGLSIRDKAFDDCDCDCDGPDDAFFILEPSLGITLNVSKNFRVEAGGSYRYISGVDELGISNDDLSGPAAHLTFKFGKFE